MQILVVNDDGIRAPGLIALARGLSGVADVTVVAPAFEKSGTSSAITVHSILKREEVYIDGEFFGYSIDGTPADCVKIGLYDIMSGRPDYIFSGINPGANLSTNVHYSGTVSAASEGLDAGITSCAVSQSVSGWDKSADFTASVNAALKWLELMEGGKVPGGVLYNLNVPAINEEEIKGFAISRLDPKGLTMEYERRVSPRGEVYYWVSGVDVSGGGSCHDSDECLMRQGYISVTPLARADRTDYNIFEQLRRNGGFAL